MKTDFGLGDEYGKIQFCPVCKGYLELQGMDTYFCWSCPMVYRIVRECEVIDNE